MTQKVLKPIALDESFRTTEQNPKNIADVLANKLDAIKSAIENGGSGEMEAAFECHYNVTSATDIYNAMQDKKVPFFYQNGVVAQLWKVETNKYTFRTTTTSQVEGENLLTIVDYIVNGAAWETHTEQISGGSSIQQAYLAKVESSVNFDTTGLSGMQSIISVNDVPADGVYQLSIFMCITPKTASATKSDLVFQFTGTSGTGMPNTTFHAVVDDSQTFGQQLSFSTTLNLKAGTNTLKMACGGLNTEYIVFVDDLTVAQLVNGVYHNGDTFEEVNDLTEASDFNVDDELLVVSPNSKRKMLWTTLASKVLGFIKSLSTTITAFRYGDVIPVDGPSGTAKMTKDDLIAVINRENANSPFITGKASNELEMALYRNKQVVLYDADVSIGSNKYADFISNVAGNYIIEISSSEDLFIKVLQNATQPAQSYIKDTIAEKFNVGVTPIRIFYAPTTTTNKIRVDGAENKTLHFKLIKLISSDALPLTNELVSTGHSLSSSTAVGKNINDKIGTNAAFDMYRVKIPLGKIHLFDAISPIPVTGVTFAVCTSSGIVTKVFKGINGSYDIDATGDDYWIYYQAIAGFEPQRPYADTDSLSFVNDAKATKGKVSDISDSLVSSENNVVLELSGTTTVSAYCYLGYTFKKGYTYLVELSTDEDFITPKIQLGTSQTEGSMVDTIGENVSLSSSPTRLLYRCSGKSSQLRIQDYKNKGFRIKVYELLALEHNYIYSTADQNIHAYVNGLKFRSELDNHITDFKKAGDLMVHVSSFCIISNVVYMTYYVNTQHATETPAEHRARFVICPLDDVDNKQYFDLQGAKESGMSGSDIVFDGHSVDALYDTILMKIDNDTLFLMWTANLDGVGYCRLYQTYTISTATFSAIQYNQFKVGDNVGTFSATNMNAFFANAGIKTKALSGDIGLMQKITSREESGVTYWYTGCYVGEFNCIVKSSDLITWEFVAQPDFFNHSQWENSVFVYGSRVFYFVRQLRSEPCAFLSVYNLDKKIWSKPIYVNDAQSRYDFFGFEGVLYLVHSPYDRNHLSIIKIDTSDECRHIELQTAIVPDYFYPYVQSYAGELYMSFTQSRQHIWLSKFTINSISDSTISSVFKTLFGLT